MKHFYLIVFLIFLLIPLFSQEVFINEVMSSNSLTIQDENGDYSDWIELYNNSDQVVNLDGHGLTDDPEEPFKWSFTSYLFQPQEYLVVYASDKNRVNIPPVWETVIDWGDTWRFFIGITAPPEDWKLRGYDDAAWMQGPSGIGYGDDDDATVIPSTISFYMRKTFTV